jgi:hypothetical protein
VDSHNIARNLDNSFLETLEVHWFRNLSKRPRARKFQLVRAILHRRVRRRMMWRCSARRRSARRSPAMILTCLLGV